MSNIINLQDAIKKGELPPGMQLQGVPVAQPMIPTKVREHIENHVKEGFEIKEDLISMIDKRVENEEPETVTMIMKTLLWLVEDRLPIES